MSVDSILAQLQDPGASIPASDLTQLSALPPGDRERFLSAWRELSIQRRRDLVDRLATLAEDSVEVDFNDIFLAGLVDPDVQVRADCVRALWEYEGPDLAAVLLKLLRDPEALVRGEAALGLGRFLVRAELEGRSDEQTSRIEAVLLSVARDEQELVEVRGRAIESLGARSHDWVVELIEEAYASGDRRLHISAIHAMGRSAEHRWLAAVIDEMENEDGEVRFEAATAAGAIGDEGAIPSLAQLTGDEDAEAQEAAIGALGQIGGAAARAVLQAVAEEQRDERVREAVAEALEAADFVDDPLGFRMEVHAGAVDEDDEEDA
ncbi:MAG: HEAT repeat domain-containing protein [Dehalococcoidia bacterium]